MAFNRRSFNWWSYQRRGETRNCGKDKGRKRDIFCRIEVILHSMLGIAIGKQYRLAGRGWWIKEIAAEYVGCSDEKWFSLGFGAAFLLACISSPGSGFFPRRNWPREENGALRIPNELPLIASRSTPTLTCPLAGYIYGRSSARWDIYAGKRWRPAPRRAPIMAFARHCVYAMYNLTKFLSLDTCREGKAWLSFRTVSRSVYVSIPWLADTYLQQNANSWIISLHKFSNLSYVDIKTKYAATRVSTFRCDQEIAGRNRGKSHEVWFFRAINPADPEAIGRGILAGIREE